MRVEALVLGRQNRVYHHVRHVANGDDRPPFLAEFAQDVALGRDDAQRNLGVVVGQAFERGKRRIKQRQHERAQQAPDEAKAEEDGPDVEEPPP